MKKIEIIWREILFQTFEKGQTRFTQKNLAEKFGFSTSTVAQALNVPRSMAAVRVSGRFFEVEDPEKLLYHWVSYRRLGTDLAYKTKVDLPIFEIEGQMVPEAIFAAYSSIRLRYKEAPADYDKVYVYHTNPKIVEDRFPKTSSKEKRYNLFVLQSDPFLSSYGQITTLAQTFVDLWNLDDWYARDFLKRLKEDLNAFLS